MAIKNKILLPLYMVLIWSVSRICKSYIAINLEVNATAFSLLALTFASLVLIFFGKGNVKAIKLAFKQKHSWIFAILDILSNITLLITFFYVGSTRASYLCQLCTVAAITYNFVKYKRKVSGYEIFACLLILSGMFYALSEANQNDLSVLITCTILSAIFLTGKSLAAEYNPLNKKIMPTEIRMKITGVAVALSSIFMGIIIALFNLIKPIIETQNKAFLYIINSAPQLKDFCDIPTLISAFLFGTIILSVSRFVYYKSSKVSSTETLLTITALSPLGTLILEFIAAKIGILSFSEINLYDIYICILISVGVVLLTISRNKHLFTLNDNKIRKMFKKSDVA